MCVTFNNLTQVKTSWITGLDIEPNRLSSESKNRKDGEEENKNRTLCEGRRFSAKIPPELFKESLTCSSEIS